MKSREQLQRFIADQRSQDKSAGLPLGSANEVIYADLLGYSAEEIANFKAAGVI